MFSARFACSSVFRIPAFLNLPLCLDVWNPVCESKTSAYHVFSKPDRHQAVCNGAYRTIAQLCLLFSVIRSPPLSTWWVTRKDLTLTIPVHITYASLFIFIAFFSDKTTKKQKNPIVRVICSQALAADENFDHLLCGLSNKWKVDPNNMEKWTMLKLCKSLVFPSWKWNLFGVNIFNCIHCTSPHNLKQLKSGKVTTLYQHFGKLWETKLNF